jgi:hypothetical protein
MWPYIRVVYVKVLVMNGSQKDMCYDEIGLCAQSIDTHLSFNN